MAIKPNVNTIRNKVFIASSYENAISGASSNTYLGVGRPITWDNSIPPQPIDTTNSTNEIFRTLVALKKINSSDINLVIPRVDWLTGTKYKEYTEDLELFTYESTTAITGTANASAGSVVLSGNSSLFTSNVSVGDKLVIRGTGGETAPLAIKEVVYVKNNVSLNVNSAFTYAYTDNVVYKQTNSTTQYINKFYVRNTLDQVFKCLYNNNNASSTTMPEINIDGNSPESPYILTADGYKWKYMYTIPSGLKEKFFTSEWMPVIAETLISEAAVNGRLSVFKINSGGSGYKAGGSAASATIINVVGDGSGANLTATVSSGVITGINIINAGVNYTKAALTFTDPTKLPSTSSANITAIIEPQNGHGYDPAYELGASNLMVSVDLAGTESSTIPTTNASDIFDYRQISIIRNPKSNTGSFISGSNYKATSIITVVPTTNNFRLDETVYQGDTLSTSTYSATVVNWDSSRNEIWVNNQAGTFSPSGSIRGTVQTSALTALSIAEPELELFTGEVLYIENREPILRNPAQTEQVKLILSF